MPKNKHGAPPGPGSREALLKKSVLEAHEWDVNARKLLEMLADMSPHAFTIEDLTKVSAEEIKGNAQAYADAQERDFDENIVTLGILEIEQWLDQNDLALSSTASYEQDVPGMEDTDGLLDEDN